MRLSNETSVVLCAAWFDLLALFVSGEDVYGEERPVVKQTEPFSVL